MNREEAWKLVEENVSGDNLKKHMLSVEAIMKALARRFDEDEQKWGLAGLLHDLDYDETFNTPEKHTTIAVDKLRALGVSEDILRTIQAHNELVTPETTMEKAIICADDITGMITACTLVRPSKKVADVKVKSVKKKLKDKSFAAGANRERIRSCENIGVPLDEFIALSLEAMTGIADQLGL
jgi:putative nucleotidyltransferase with HDIG domain